MGGCLPESTDRSSKSKVVHAERVGGSSPRSFTEAATSRHWGDAPVHSSPPRPPAGGADVADAALPTAAYLDLLADTPLETIHTADPLPFLNATEPMSLADADASETPSEAAELDSYDFVEAQSSFLQKSLHR